MGKPKRLQISNLCKTLIFLGSCIALTTFGASTDNIELDLGEQTNYYKLSDKESKFFMVRIDPDKFDGSQDLIIKAQASDFYGDPDIFISTKNSKPNNKDTSEQMCATYGKDICAVNHNKLKAGQFVYIGIKCLQECKFKLRTFLTEQIQLDDGQDLQLDFEAEETKIFKFYIPPSSSTKDEQNRVNSLVITAVPLISQQDNIILTASTSKDSLASSSSKKGVPGWRKGQVLRLSEYFAEDWCTDCWVTIMVDVSDIGKYNIMAKTNVGVLQLQQDKKVDDVAFFGDKTCYKYYVQSATNDLVLKVQQYSGLVSFTVNPKKPAESYDSSAFKYIGTSNLNLIITAKERQQVQQQKGLYYICAVPHMTSTYSIMVTEPSKNQAFTFLEDGYDENGALTGSDMAVYVYKVPPLEYMGEDIQLRFHLSTTSGEKPAMAATFCQDNKDFKKCASNVTSESVLGSKSTYTKAKIVGKDLELYIDHDERTCKDTYNGECYYVVVLIGQSQPDQVTTYEISVTHSQLNYQVLSEGSILTDYVNLGNYKYYSFTLLKEGPTQKVQKVTFKLNTLHGDADIYVSRIHPQPNKIDYEKSSVKTLAIVDEVSFDDANLETTYHIGIYSFQYSTFNLVVKVDRGEDSTALQNIPALSEGLPFTGSIHNENQHDIYQIYIKQLPGYEKDIKIQTQALQGKVEIYVNYGKVASSSNFIWYSKTGSVDIKTKDPNFHSDGEYYITVYPRYKFWNKVTDDYYNYIIVYSTQDSYLYLQNAVALETTQAANTYQHYRHFVTKNSEDIAVSMTVFNGDPQMFVSVNPDNKFPTHKYHEFSSRNQAVISGAKGKSLFLSSSQIKKSNPICNSNIGTVDAEPCAIFIGVQCESDCKYSMKLSYEKDGPQQLVVGVPQHDMVKDGSFNYYYLIIRENKTKQIYGVLNSLSGNADLYVKFQDNPQEKSPDTWTLPSKSEYALKSVELLKQDMVVINPLTLTDCFSRYKSNEAGEERQCAIIFGIFSPPTNQADSDHQTRYNFVAYSDVIYIASGSTQSGKVDEREFQYYIFEALCDDCPIVVSLSTFSSGDPDLYINFGDTQLPTTTSYDMQSSTFKSELLKIDLDLEEVQNKKMKSLKGSYIIGVYGKKKSDYQISVTQEKNPIATLVSGYSLKISQPMFETTYFMYFHMQDEKDFKLALDVKIGEVDVFISTFKENEDNQNFADRLPKSKRTAQWVTEGIKATSSSDQKEILILNQERNYCSHCYYLIAVSTHDYKADYNILVHSLDANFDNALLLKFGEQQTFTAQQNETRVFRFIIDSYDSITIQVRETSGYVQAYLNTQPTKERSIVQLYAFQDFKLEKNNPNFHTGQMYYIICESSVNSTYSILIQQSSTVLQLKDGVPLKVSQIDKEDINKYLVYYLQDGDQTVDIQIKSKTQGFNPLLYMKFFDDLESSFQNILFPPAGDSGFTVAFQWNKELQTLHYKETFKNIKGGKAGLAMNLYSGHLKDVKTEYGESPSAFITITTSSVIQMVKGDIYQGALKHQNSYLIYSVDVQKEQDGFMVIEFAQCRGNAKLDIVDAPNVNGKSTIKNLEGSYEHGRNYYYVPLPRENLYILVQPTEMQYDDETENEVTDFLIRVRYNTHKANSLGNYYIQSDNYVHWELLSTWSNKVNLTWNNLYWVNNNGNLLKNQEDYNILMTSNDRVKLNSMCILRNDLQKESGITVYRTNYTNYTLPSIVPGKKYYVNVMGRASMGGEDDMIVPYEPIEIYIKVDSGYLTTSNIIIVMTLILAIFAILYLYKRLNKKDDFYREKPISRQIEYELTSVRSKPSNVGEYQRPIDLIKGIGEEEAFTLNTSQMNGVDDTRGYGF